MIILMEETATNYLVFIPVIALALVGIWLFFGIYREKEYGTYHVFLKHRPTLRFFFSSTYRTTISHLSPKEQQALRNKEHYYREFVEERGGSIRSLFIGLRKYAD